MKVLGLKPIRFREWLAVIKLEGKSLGTLSLVKMVIRGLAFGVGRHTWRTRLRTCMSCPIYNVGLRQCRQGKFGCGCYVPFLALTRGECWGKTNTSNLGWE